MAAQPHRNDDDIPVQVTAQRVNGKIFLDV
jgi:hypothetical protein